MWNHLTMVRINSKVAQGGLALMLALTALTGCRSDGSQKLPQDPLFVRKQPLEVQPEAGPPQAVARTELTMPADPLSSLAAKKGTGTFFADIGSLPPLEILRKRCLSPFSPLGANNPLLLP